MTKKTLSESLCIRLSEEDMARLERLAVQGKHASATEAIRHAVREYLDREEAEG